MIFDITPPTSGVVTLELSWDEAEIVTRALGLINAGNMRENAPNLCQFVESMVELVGRSNSSEARKFLVTSGRFNQMYIHELEGQAGFRNSKSHG